MSGRAFPIAVRRAVAERAKGFCESCGVSIDNRPSHFDHVQPWQLEGKSTLANCMLLCAVAPDSCHAKKTREDVARIAKAKRQKLHHETGRSRARRGRPLQSRGFDRTLRKRMDGTVTKRVA